MTRPLRLALLLALAACSEDRPGATAPPAGGSTDAPGPPMHPDRIHGEMSTAEFKKFDPAEVTRGGQIVLPRRSPDAAFLVYPNYRAFMAWNRSTFFAISVGTLADRLAGGASLDLCGG